MPKYMIELAGPKNERIAFNPTKALYRGAWRASAVATRSKLPSMNHMSAIPKIPGMVIVLDTDERRGMIYDPLGVDDGKKILNQANEVHAKYPSTFGGPWKPNETQTFSDMTLDQVKDWAHHMSNLRTSGLAMPWKGSDDLPPVSEIKKWEGKRVSDHFNTGPQKEVLSKYTDEVKAVVTPNMNKAPGSFSGGSDV